MSALVSRRTMSATVQDVPLAGLGRLLDTQLDLQAVRGQARSSIGRHIRSVA